MRNLIVYSYTSTYARKQGYNWTKKWYAHVPKPVETSQGGKVTNKYKLTELSPTTNRTL